MKTKFLILISIFIAGTLYSQKDWSKVNFADEYKRKVKIKGGASKSLKKNKTFVNGYTISQAVTMTGSEKTATKAVYSEVSLNGLSNEAYQEMTDELYRQFIKELKAAGLQITTGEDVLASDQAQKRIKKDRKDEIIGSTGKQPAYEGKKKITEGSIPGYGVWAVTRDISFPPRNKNVYLTSDVVKSGLFYGNLASRENFNLLRVNFYVSFASFDGGRGYKDIKLSTKPVLAVSATVQLVTSNGSFNEIYYKKLPAWGSAEWSLGIDKSKDNKHTAEFLGLARSAEYQITADETKYLAEVKYIINHLQKDIAQAIKENL